MQKANERAKNPFCHGTKRNVLLNLPPCTAVTQNAETGLARRDRMVYSSGSRKDGPTRWRAAGRAVRSRFGTCCKPVSSVSRTRPACVRAEKRPRTNKGVGYLPGIELPDTSAADASSLPILILIPALRGKSKSKMFSLSASAKFSAHARFSLDTTTPLYVHRTP